MINLVKLQKESILRLFRGYLISDINEVQSLELQNEFTIEAAKYGLVFPNTSNPVPEDIFNIAKEMYGKGDEKWNESFHKSFSTVRDSSLGELIAQQIIHYFTTYGLEALDLYNKELVYIPKEEVELPDIKADLALAIIKPYTIDQIKEKLMTLLKSGIALSKKTIEDILNISDFIANEDLDSIKNKEIKIMLYDKYDTAPRNNMEFLRYLIYKATGDTLLIKNSGLINKIKKADIMNYYSLLCSYINGKDGYINLAQIFLRYKDLFLAFKRDDNNEYAKMVNKIINKVSKLAKTNHIPLEQSILDNLTAIKTPEEALLKAKNISKALNNITVFREIRIVNSLRYRKTNNKPILYKIRNGRSFVQEIDKKDDKEIKALGIILNLVMNHLIERLQPALKDKNVYIPNMITYMVPASEKQFNGNIPEGSFIEIDKDDVVIGVHWKNFKDERVDLDLHSQDRSNHYGWNASYRNKKDEIYYSGDVTDAKLPTGATEVFFIGKTLKEQAFILTLNTFTGNSRPVPYEFMIAKAKREDINNNYVVNPNNILIKLNNETEPNQNSKVLGLVKIDNTIRYYFNDFTSGNAVATKQNDVTMNALDYMKLYSQTQLTMNELLIKCGANLLDSPYSEKLEEVLISDSKGKSSETLFRKVEVKADVDLSLEAITKETLIKLLTEV